METFVHFMEAYTKYKAINDPKIHYHNKSETKDLIECFQEGIIAHFILFNYHNDNDIPPNKFSNRITDSNIGNNSHNNHLVKNNINNTNNDNEKNDEKEYNIMNNKEIKISNKKNKNIKENF